MISLTLSMPSFAFASGDGSVVKTCLKEFDEADACQCSATRLERFIGKYDFQRYEEFFDVFSQANLAARSDQEIVVMWNAAMERYARQYGEDRLEVIGFIPKIEKLHRYALNACGIESKTSKKSLFFFGETR